MKTTRIHKNYISRCFYLAKKGRGFVSPNPLVGAVLVKDCRIIGEGYHQRFGGPHAEVNAIEAAIEPVEGATLYVNLEPCCHLNKKTPPCAQRIVAEKIARVVISNRDPNPKVSGRGLQLLRDAGIEVEEGILNEEGAWLNRFYFKHVSSGLPWVTVKIAQTKDGFIAREKGKQSWITGPGARKEVHRIRAEHDAVLVGAGTVLADDPQLTVREVKGPNPVRVILDGKLRSVGSRKVFDDEHRERTWVLCGKPVSRGKLEYLHKKGCRVISLPKNDSGIDLKTVLKLLAENKVISLLIEGGQEVFTQFLSENLVDELLVIQSESKWLNGLPAFGKEIDVQSYYKLENEKKLGADRLFQYILKNKV